MNEINADYTHFTGQAHLLGKTHNWTRKALLKDILVDNPKVCVSAHSLKIRLVREGLLKWECSRCKINKWMDQPLALELEHINGNKYDNRIENLQILCPNCHSLTPTYRGRKNKINIVNDPLDSGSTKLWKVN